MSGWLWAEDVQGNKIIVMKLFQNLSLREKLELLFYFGVLITVGLLLGRFIPSANPHSIGLAQNIEVSGYVGGFGITFTMSGGASLLGFGSRHLFLKLLSSNHESDVKIYTIVVSIVVLSIGVLLSIIYLWAFVGLRFLFEFLTSSTA